MSWVFYCQLRNMAFKKIPPKSCAPPPCMTLSGIASELLSPASRDPNIPSEDWQQWKQRDEQVRRQVHVKTRFSYIPSPLQMPTLIKVSHIKCFNALFMCCDIGKALQIYWYGNIGGLFWAWTTKSSKLITIACFNVLHQSCCNPVRVLFWEDYVILVILELYRVALLS